MKVRLAAALVLALVVFAAPAQANVLTNSSFERPSGQGWTLVGAGGPVEVGTLTTPGVAREGVGFGVARTPNAGSSFIQDVGVANGPGQSYSYSVWVRSADGQPFRGRIALWGLGLNPSEASVTDFVAGGSWTLISAPLSPATAHDTLRAEIYLLTPNADLYVDGAQVIENKLVNASFEQGFGGWATQEGVGASAALVPGAAREGNGVATVATGIPGRSFFQDVGIGAAPGQTWVYSAWVRSASGRPISAQMTLWALGGTQEAGSTQFTADGNWTLVSAPVSVTTGGHTALRSELYLNTVNENLQVDGAQLVNTGLANSSWELAYFSGWDTYPFGAPAAAVSGTGGREGTGLGSVVVADAGRAVTQSLAAPAPGQSRVFSAWVRSPSNQPLAGALTLRALGGSEESGTTPFVVGRRWTLISAPLNVAQGSHTSMRAEVTVNTPGVELQVDGASLAAGNARDDTALGYVADPAPVPVPPIVEPPLTFVRSAISYKWSNNKGNYTRMVRLIVRDVPDGGTVELRCKGKGCPTKKTVVRKRIATTSFKTLFGKRRLKTGATVEVRVLAPKMIGKVAKFTMRRKKLPKVAFSCMAPGAKAPAKCPK